ncbi:MAG: hypothetical protein U9R57_05305 [Thermodesulfobacteriota bacterium]|nr:hypothetical protein [Thermodesulfobacteriota bacterium]
MTEIKIHSDHASTKAVFSEAIKAEEHRIGYALQLGKKKLDLFEKKYGVSSETFLRDWTAENLDGRDIEYVEWAGEAKLYSRMRERLTILEGIEYVD